MTAKKKAITTQDLLAEAKSDPLEGADIAPAKDTKTRDNFQYQGLTFGERLSKLREDKGYIQKLTGNGMDYSAVLYEALVEQVRPLFIRYGISWHTHSCHVIGEHHFTSEFSGMLVSSTMMMFTIRFQNVEGSPAAYDDRPEADWYRDIVVPATAFDAFDPGSANPRGDTGAASATTTAQKYALRQILNLAAGDDPDFTPMISLSTMAQEERKTMIKRLRAGIEAQGLDADTWIAKIIQETNRDFHRSVTNVEDVETGILLSWVIRAEDAAESVAAKKEANDGNTTGSSGGQKSDSGKPASDSPQSQG